MGAWDMARSKSFWGRHTVNMRSALLMLLDRPNLESVSAVSKVLNNVPVLAPPFYWSARWCHGTTLRKLPNISEKVPEIRQVLVMGPHLN